MKLKTKFQDEDFDLGEVVDGVVVECLGKHEEKLRVIATAVNGSQRTFYYSSIKEFMDDWEDAPEEPKGIVKVEKGIVPTCVYIICATEKDAEKAVGKLNAWERLRDKGFRFGGWHDDYTIDFTINGQNIEPLGADGLLRDLCAVFGGEE